MIDRNIAIILCATFLANINYGLAAPFLPQLLEGKGIQQAWTGLIFAIYVAVFFLVKSEWNNVRKHKRLQRLQECRNAIELETMANDSEVATQHTSLIDGLATRPLPSQPMVQPPPAGYAPIITNYAPTAPEPRTPPPSYPSLTGWM